MTRYTNQPESPMSTAADTLRCALVQADTRWADPDANRENLARLMDSAPDCGLYVLPETCNTGFLGDEDLEKAGRGAEIRDGGEVAWLEAQARDRGAAIACSIVVEEDGKLFNRFVLARPDAESAIYDKRHLFGFGGEGKRYTAGNRRVRAELSGGRVGCAGRVAGGAAGRSRTGRDVRAGFCRPGRDPEKVPVPAGAGPLFDRELIKKHQSQKSVKSGTRRARRRARRTRRKDLVFLRLGRLKPNLAEIRRRRRADLRQSIARVSEAHPGPGPNQPEAPDARYALIRATNLHGLGDVLAGGPGLDWEIDV